jgi:FixJ family two-component response regulator
MNNFKTRVVYVVDDDDAVRDSTRALLQSAGFITREFASATELLDATRGGHPDVLILDMDMSGMNGLELLGRLRARNCRAPVIFATAAAEELTQKIADAGIVAVLGKPVADDLLLHWIEQACAQN